MSNTLNNMDTGNDKVVKCNGCALHFMYTEKVKKCPFCRAEYVEEVSKPRVIRIQTDTESKVSDDSKEKKATTKTRKESFRMWNQ